AGQRVEVGSRHRRSGRRDVEPGDGRDRSAGRIHPGHAGARERHGGPGQHARNEPWRLTMTAPAIHVVGLGPAGPDLLTAGTLALIDAHDHRYLRTERHPAAVAVTGARTFDHVYEQSESMREVYPRIVDELVAAAVEHGAVLY